MLMVHQLQFILVVSNSTPDDGQLRKIAAFAAQRRLHDVGTLEKNTRHVGTFGKASEGHSGLDLPRKCSEK